MKRDFVYYWKLRQRELDRFIDKEIGTISKKFCVNRSCPLCGYDKSRLLFIKGGFRFVKCGRCSMVYVNPILKEELIENQYISCKSKDYYQSLITKEFEEIDKRYYKKLINAIERRTVLKKGNFLDIGCSYGTMISIAKKQGYNVFGIELSNKCVGYIKRRYGIKVKQKQLEKIKFPDNFFDVVTMSQVIEHIVDPLSILKEINRIMKKNAILWIGTPNLNGLAIKVMKKEHTFFYGDGHLSYFDKETARKILGKSGFRDIEIRTKDFEFLRLLLFLGGKRKGTEVEASKLISRMPAEGGFLRFFYYKIAMPISAKIVEGIGMGDYLDVYAKK